MNEEKQQKKKKHARITITQMSQIPLYFNDSIDNALNAKYLNENIV